MNRAGLVTLVAGFLLTGCVAPSSSTSPALSRFEFQQPQMGVPFRIVLYAPDAFTATNAAQAAFERVAELNSKLSDYDPHSELSQLSRSSGRGRSVPVGPDLWLLLKRSEEMARRSDGAFDITVGPAVNLWRKARRDHQLPSATRLAAARQAIGYEKVHLHADARAAELEAPEMRLDLGGIAKGYAADQALAVLRTNGIHRALVAAAGDIAVGAAPPERKGWKIEIPFAEVSNAPPSLYVLLEHAALSTSGDTFQQVEIDGIHYSHIVDPRTALGLTNSILVNIIARDGTTADALATAVSVLGPARGLKLVSQFPGAAARILEQDGAKIRATNSTSFSRFVLE